MNIIFCPEKRDYVQALTSNLRRIRKKRKLWKKIFIGILIGFCVFAAFLLLWIDGPRGLVESPLIWLLLILLLGFNCHTLAYLSATINLRRGIADKHHFEKKTATLTSDSVLIEHSLGGFHEAVGYLTITDLYLTRTQIMAMLGSSAVFYIPRRFFESEEHYQTFFALFLQFYEAAKSAPAPAVGAETSAEPSGQERYRYAYDATADDFIQLQMAYSRFMRRHYGKADLGFWLLLIGFVFFVVMGIITIAGGSIIWGIYLCVVGLLCVYFFLLLYARTPVLVRFAANLLLKKGVQMGGAIGPRECIFGDCGVTQIIAGTKLFTDWAQIDHHWVDGEQLMLLSGRRHILSLPVYCVPPEQRVELQRFIWDHMAVKPTAL